MKVEQIALRHVATVEPSATLEQAAKRMAEEGVGSLVVVDRGAVTGIITDRDLVVHGIAGGVPLDARIDGVMTIGPITIGAETDVRDAIDIFGQHAFRRLPVTRGGHLVGMVSVDDLIVSLAEQFVEITRGVAGQLMFPHAADEARAPMKVH